ncbi:serine/threonine-protein kinase [Sorangium sp. So ce321]|uniref:serine/threonine-protein kinase n=1 Tax=Sorangium sp. So ce321 TaxID=3133300 RepID=UPI003F63852C
MSTKLKPQLKNFFNLLSSKQAGTILTESEILLKTGWEPDTLGTHRRKNKLDPFLAQEGKGIYRVLRDGTTLTTDEISDAFTQKRPSQLTITKGVTISGLKADYELINYLNSGAAAHVWKCRNIATGEICAAKIVNPRTDLLKPANLQVLRERFSREVKNGIRLSHPNIVVHRDFGEVDDHPFLIMDLADQSVADMLKSGPLSPHQALEVVESSLLGLKCIHDSGCVHRDVKPPNILRFATRFVIGDLGIVRWSDMNPEFTSAETLTQASIHLGSWYYMAPEQRRLPHDVSSACDIYALGISWFEMLTGNTPDPAEVAARQFNEPSSDAEVNHLIKSMLAYAPSDRPTTNQLLDHIQKLRGRL